MSPKRTRQLPSRLYRQRKARRTSNPPRLGFETLESGQLLTAVTGNSLADLSGNIVTLRDAIQAANNDVEVLLGGPVGSGADTITFDPALSGSTINLNQSLGHLNATTATSAEVILQTTSKRIDLAIAFVTRDRIDFGQRAETILAEPNQETKADVIFLLRSNDQTRLTHSVNTQDSTTRHDNRSNTQMNRLYAWEDVFNAALDEE